MFPQDSVIDLTRRQFDLPGSDAIQVQPIEKGGSDRSFYRVTMGDRSLILVRYSGHKEENRHYVAAAGFLERVGLNVPHIYFHDERDGLIWMQDLGADDLWAFRNAPRDEKIARFQSALHQAFLMHSRALALLPGSNVIVQKEFSAELYRWEQHYFLENCVGRFFGIPETEWNLVNEQPGMIRLAEGLAAQPRVLVHRDFQSQNVMVLNEESFLIDFQGMRPGLGQYDVASMLYDPYTDLSHEEREELLGGYLAELSEEEDVHQELYRDIYLRAAAQRLMQALGAYGYLGMACDRPRFLDFIPVALPRLAAVLTELADPTLQPTLDLVNKMIESPRAYPAR